MSRDSLSQRLRKSESSGIMSTNGIASTFAAHAELDAQDDARQSTPERNLRGAVMFHLRFILGLFHFISLFGSLTTAGCLLLVCILIHCTVSTHVNEGACYALWASRCDLRDPGWGDPGFPRRWSCLLFLHLLRALAVMFWTRVCFLQDRIHRHTSCCNLTRAHMSITTVFLCCFFCWFAGPLFVVLFFVPGWSPSHMDYLDCV